MDDSVAIKMEERRKEFHLLLEGMLESKNVYFQPPSDNRVAKLKYPCIVYQLDNIDELYADSIPYGWTLQYSVTYISKLPDMKVPQRIASIPTAAFSRFFTTENLNHYVYRIFY